MAITDVTICNSALLKIGADRIVSLSDTTKSAIVCAEQYPKLRDEVLTKHPWNFALARASLAPVLPAPAWGYANNFQLPTDCLRVLSTDYPDDDFKIEGRMVLSDSSGLNILYVKQQLDTSQYTPTFAEVLSLRLAADLCYSVANSATLAKEMYQAYLDQLKAARSADAQEGSADEFTVNTWKNARY